MEQEVDELRCKLDVSEQRLIDVEAKLVEGALTTAGHAIGILKSYLPDLDVSQVSRGYNFGQGEADKLYGECRAALEPFVENLKLSISDEEEQEEE